MLIGLNLNLTNGILKTNVRTDCGCWAALDPEGRPGRLIPSSQHSRQIRSLPVSARIRCGLSVLMSRMVLVPGTAPLIPDRHHTFLHHNLTAPTCMESPSVCLATRTVSTPLLLLGEERRGEAFTLTHFQYLKILF